MSLENKILFLTHATCLKLSFYFESTFDWPLALLSLLFREKSSLSSAREQTQTEIHLLWQPLPVICSAAAAAAKVDRSHWGSWKTNVGEDFEKRRQNFE